MKIFSWFSGLTYAMFYLFGPEHLGGKGNVRLLIDEEVSRTGRPLKEVAQEVRLLQGALPYANNILSQATQLAFASTGKVVRIPGMIPMYDHEYHPQIVSGQRRAICARSMHVY